jgi:hypothetical protein
MQTCYQHVNTIRDANDKNGTNIVSTFGMICMNNACSSNSKSPFTKLMDLVLNYSISFSMDKFITKKNT